MVKQKTKKAVAEARLANPDDSSLILTKIYIWSKDFEKYKVLFLKCWKKILMTLI
jgi:hypothetical protein